MPMMNGRYCNMTINQYRQRPQLAFTELIIDEDNKALITYLQNYLQQLENKLSSGENIIVTGNVGTGKTCIIKAFLQELTKQTLAFTRIKHKYNYTDPDELETINRSLTTTYTTIYQLLQDLRQVAYADQKDNAIDTTVDILAIDEVGVQLNTDAERQILFDFFNYRYEHCLPTIVISNHTIADTQHRSLRKILGSRIIDRLLSGQSQEFILKGQSRRRDNNSQSLTTR